MIRLLFWWLGMTFWDGTALLIQLSGGRLLARWAQPTVNFAFGANLDPAVLARRRVRPLAQQDFLLRDHALRFNQAGPYKGFGFASAQHAPGELTFGRLLTLRRVDAIRMNYFELVPFLHKHRTVVASQDGHTFFFYQATWPRENLIPTPEYLGKILRAAEQSTVLPADYLARLQATPALTDLEPPDALHFLIRDYNAPPADKIQGLAGLRRRLDLACVRLFQWLYAHAPLRRFLHV